MPTIVTCFPITPAQIQRITELDSDCKVINAPQEMIGKEIFKADFFFGHAKTPVDWDAVVDQGRLRWIQSSAAGLDHCLKPAVIQSDIPVSGCSRLFAPQVAETTLALAMGLLRSLPTFFRAQQNKEYVRRYTDEIYDKTVGIIGYGGNGQQIAKAFRPLARKLIATDRFPESTIVSGYEGLVDQLLPNDQLERLLKEADIVISTLPLSESNEKLLSDAQFSMMKKDSYFINVGRGSVVDEPALIRHIQNGHLKGVGMDVADPEPIATDSPLWEAPHVIITPHIGAQSLYRVPRTIDLFCENFRRFQSGQTLINLVDKPLGYPRPEHRFQGEF